MDIKKKKKNISECHSGPISVIRSAFLGAPFFLSDPRHNAWNDVQNCRNMSKAMVPILLFFNEFFKIILTFIWIFTQICNLDKIICIYWYENTFLYIKSNRKINTNWSSCFKLKKWSGVNFLNNFVRCADLWRLALKFYTSKKILKS